MTQTESNEIRQSLLREAARLFAERGYDAVSVREIVEASGCTKPAMYYHFGSKDGVAVALFEEFIQAALAMRDRAFESAQSPYDAFVLYAKGMLDAAPEFRNTLAFGFSIWFGRTSLKDLMAKVKETDEQAYEAWKTELIRLGLAPEIAMPTVRSFWALLLHELMQAVACPKWQGNSDELARQIATVTLYGVTSLGKDEAQLISKTETPERA
jgi:AcrR family transcriptional regulator